ncbi:MAG: dehydratase [Burkholderiales bacterium PBB5]|nr:MAG: dehydratase [Burkholderiales bacterium PBB5]
MSAMPDWSALQVGDALPPLALPPVSRLTLALYCGASGDHNPLHVDTDFAHAAGLPDVIAHGMLSAAIRTLDVRFAAMTGVGEHIVCTGRVTQKFVTADGLRCARLVLATHNRDGVAKLGAEAVVAWPVTPAEESLS